MTYPFRTTRVKVNSRLTPDLMANERMKDPVPHFQRQQARVAYIRLTKSPFDSQHQRPLGVSRKLFDLFFIPPDQALAMFTHIYKKLLSHFFILRDSKEGIHGCQGERASNLGRATGCSYK